MQPARRTFVRALAAAAALAPLPHFAQPAPPTRRAIPSTGEQIPSIGVGTWLTFDAGVERTRRSALAPVLRAFFERGGTMIDSSPMYGSSESVIGELLETLGRRDLAFAATKVWTLGRGAGIGQMEASRKLWGVGRFDLLQVHNLVDWSVHLRTLKAWKAEGRVRYVGLTTSHGRRHAELERAMLREPLDFVQFTYSLADRDAESRLLPLAADRGIAVIANRPFDGGALFDRVRGQRLPEWAREADCANWAQVFLKFSVSHPAVTCAIPATSRADHMLENMGALYGRLPDAATRGRMARYFDAL